VSGWFVGDWWEGSPKEQKMLEEKYGCTVENRKSLVPYILAPKLTTGKVVSNYTAVADNGYVSY